MEKQYQQEFGTDFPLGIRIPDYFEDQSWRNDSGPSFVYMKGNNLLKICVLPEDPGHRDIEGGKRYSLMRLKTSPGDDYQEFVDVLFETESPEEFEQVIFDQAKLKHWLSTDATEGGA